MIRKEEVLVLSGMAGLPIEEKRLPAVLANLQRIEQVAMAVLTVPLAPEDEIGPEWRP